MYCLGYGGDIFMSMKRMIQAAHGDIPADVIFRNAKLLNVLSAEILPGSVAVFNGKVIGFGEYEAVHEIDLGGRYLLPGFIDGHVHLESSMLSPAEFAREILPVGTTAVIIDPHEIVNVMGERGLEYILDSTWNLPLDVYVMLSSCVPATHLETSGAEFTAEQMRKWIMHPRILGIGEMMNFPGVIHADPQVLEKITTAAGKIIDGHAPLVSGKDLAAYVSAGISSDHECSQIEEAREKLRNGMFIMIREGSAARNLATILPLVNVQNSRFFGFVTDDRHPDFLLEHGHINSMIRTAIGAGIDPITAVQMATINTARYFRLPGVGAVAPGYKADFAIVDNLDNFRVVQVFKNGKMVAQDGELIIASRADTQNITNTVNIGDFSINHLKVPSTGGNMRVIEIVPNQIITQKTICPVAIVDGEAVSDPASDLLKMVVVERHRATGNVGIGFVRGFGIQTGALASTVAHDSHNLIAIGATDKDILAAIRAVKEMQGGQVVIRDGQVLAGLALPIAGLMSDQPLGIVKQAGDRLVGAARTLGCRLANPFMTLSFLALPVIPALKLTDKGLVDVERFEIVPLFCD